MWRGFQTTPFLPNAQRLVPYWQLLGMMISCWRWRGEEASLNVSRLWTEKNYHSCTVDLSCQAVRMCGSPRRCDGPGLCISNSSFLQLVEDSPLASPSRCVLSRQPTAHSIFSTSGQLMHHVLSNCQKCILHTSITWLRVVSDTPWLIINTLISGVTADGKVCCNNTTLSISSIVVTGNFHEISLQMSPQYRRLNELCCSLLIGT